MVYIPIEKTINFQTDLISDAYFNVTEGLESIETINR